ncbi:electron transport complex, RnfABCDGE type, D subunit [Sphaerochaeta pleomorpha str. Grapes]|uniref:Ion-translocating oxidoreductase complex subunit D n=1 Tax=Sphaerochaeta pleomorpha (strain ATCC BAA-1885 / DSM 22778 / Grapes) TaxID=158190 RepID=G8QWN1_SPHPG|nr:RnfABCDGE type electron transport complex subunit D [Sphaerochaeta pleomorpha]AEV28325.1 electron transport complex, RnfABCDGE type, D subunit [Sphaerochaeta pleomorpha str. Grapes]
MMKPSLSVSASPHIHAKADTASIMWTVSLALLPASVWGVYAFGLRSLLVLAVSIGTAVLFEFLLGLFSHEDTLWDGSAFLTGLLVGLNMSPSIPLFIPCIASFFAIVVAKWTFGGLGANWVNPALAGRVFVFFSFTTPMSRYSMPRALAKLVPDALSSATPLSFTKTAIVSGSLGMSTDQLLSSGGYPASDFAVNLSKTLGLSPYTIDSFVGNVGGCIGEVSALLLLVGGIYLLVKKVISWQTSTTYIVSVALLSWIFGGLRADLGLFKGDVLSSVFTGGLMLGAIFMATDYVTSPITRKGQIIFGLGCGFFTFLFRYFGSMPEAVSVSILLMNIVTPTIDRFVVPRKFGDTKEYRKQMKEEKV